MTTRKQVVAEAREWLGTPWVHQGRLKGVGVDCTNFIACVAENSGAVSDVNFANDYRGNSDGTTLLGLLRNYLDNVPDKTAMLPGDVVAIKSKDENWHVAIVTQLTPYPKIIHASAERKLVVEHRLDAHLRSLFHSVWKVRGITDD